MQWCTGGRASVCSDIGLLEYVGRAYVVPMAQELALWGGAAVVVLLVLIAIPSVRRLVGGVMRGR